MALNHTVLYSIRVSPRCVALLYFTVPVAVVKTICAGQIFWCVPVTGTVSSDAKNAGAPGRMPYARFGRRVAVGTVRRKAHESCAGAAAPGAVCEQVSYNSGELESWLLLFVYIFRDLNILAAFVR